MSVIDFPGSPVPPTGDPQIAAALAKGELQMELIYMRAKLSVLAYDLARQSNALSDEVIKISLGCDHILEMLR